MRIIDTVTTWDSGRTMHRVAVEFEDGRKTHAVIFRDHAETETYVSLAAACKIAGVSEGAYRAYLKERDFETVHAIVPAAINGTLQARKMVFSNALYVAEYLKHAGAEYHGMCSWFNSIGRSSLDAVIGFNGAMNPVEAKRAGLLSIPVDEPTAAVAAPVTTVSIDFDATGGIEQLNRVVSSLDVPYQVRARALSIQNDFSQLANVISTLNTTGKDA